MSAIAVITGVIFGVILVNVGVIVAVFVVVVVVTLAALPRKVQHNPLTVTDLTRFH